MSTAAVNRKDSNNQDTNRKLNKRDVNRVRKQDQSENYRPNTGPHRGMPRPRFDGPGPRGMDHFMPDHSGGPFTHNVPLLKGNRGGQGLLGSGPGLLPTPPLPPRPGCFMGPDYDDGPSMGPPGPPMGPPGPPMGLPGPHMRPPGPPMGPHGPHMGPPMGPRGPPMGPPGPRMGTRMPGHGPPSRPGPGRGGGLLGPGPEMFDDDYGPYDQGCGPGWGPGPHGFGGGPPPPPPPEMRDGHWKYGGGPGCGPGGGSAGGKSLLGEPPAGLPMMNQQPPHNSRNNQYSGGYSHHYNGRANYGDMGSPGGGGYSDDYNTYSTSSVYGSHCAENYYNAGGGSNSYSRTSNQGLRLKWRTVEGGSGGGGSYYSSRN